MSFQYCSDIHLELLTDCNQNKLNKFIEARIKPVANFLILAGDIGHAHRVNYKHLLEWCSAHFEKTFIVSGNHEYYSTLRYAFKLEEVDENLKEVCSQFENIFFLQKDFYEFDYTSDEGEKCKYIILGCTFWAPIPEHFEGQIAVLMNDFRHINNNEGLLLKPYESNQLHEDHKKWLFSKLDEIHSSYPGELNFKVIVITHHAPCLNLNLKRDIQYGYAADYEEIIENNVHAWVSGHTHEVRDYQSKHGVKFLSNCIGYKCQKTGFKPDAYFT